MATTDDSTRAPMLAPVPSKNPDSLTVPRVILAIWFVASMLAAGQIYGTLVSEYGVVEFGDFVAGMVIGVIANLPVIAIFMVVTKMHRTIVAMRDAPLSGTATPPDA